MTDWTLIHADELLAEMRETSSCLDCAGGLGVHVQHDGEWTVVQMHDIPCPVAGRP